MSLDSVRMHLVLDWEEGEKLLRWLPTVQGALGIDTETGGLDWWREPLRTVQFGDEHHGWVVPYDRWAGLCQEVVNRWDDDIVLQNAKFDLHFMEHHGMSVPRHRVHDTKIAATLLNNDRSNSLKSLGSGLIDSRANLLEKDLQQGFKDYGWSWRTVPIEFGPYWMYAALDPILTRRVWDVLEASGLSRFSWLYDLENGVQQTVTDMERRGVQIDAGYCQLTLDALHQGLDELREEIKRRFKVENPGSSHQVAKALEADGVKVPLTDKGNPNLNKEALQNLEHPLSELVLRYRHDDKEASTYLANYLDYMDENERLHASVNLLGARTGRMSVSRPSMQNLPRGATVRDAFIPREGHKLLLIDYDAIELRLLAHYARIDDLIEAANSGVDMHTVTARKIYGLDEDAAPTKKQRQLTKNTTYTKLYGGGVGKVAETAGISFDEAHSFVALYDQQYPEVVGFQDMVQQRAYDRFDQDGYGWIETHYGRQLRIGDPNKAYKLVNYLIQGTAADVLKLKLLELDLAGLADHAVLPVHDELVFEVPDEDVEEYSHEVVKVMEDHTEFSTPLTVGVEVVDRWGDKYRGG